MFDSGMTSAATLGEVCVIVFISAAVLATLAVVGATRYALVAAPSEQSFREWLDAYAATDTSRRITASARAVPVFLSPDPAAGAEELVSEMPESLECGPLPFEPLVPEVFPSLTRIEIPPATSAPAEVWRGAEYYRVTLADLIEGSRYVVPVPTRRVSTDAPRHYSRTIDTAGRHDGAVGRHRAPALVAA